MTQDMVDRIGRVTASKGWVKDWLCGGCYLHLEASEFIESLRGKGDDPPEKEAGDVIVALFAVLAYHKIPLAAVEASLESTLQGLESQAPG